MFELIFSISLPLIDKPVSFGDAFTNLKTEVIKVTFLDCIAKKEEKTKINIRTLLLAVMVLDII